MAQVLGPTIGPSGDGAASQKSVRVHIDGVRKRLGRVPQFITAGFPGS